MIYSHQDSWTLEGIVQSVPLLGWWYDNVVRYVTHFNSKRGKCLTCLYEEFIVISNIIRTSPWLIEKFWPQS